MADRGISSLSVEYRVRSRHGTTICDSLSDALDAMPVLRGWANGLPMIVVGASAGGLMACHLARDKRLPAAGVVLINPVLDLSATGFVSKATPPGGDNSLSPLHMPIRHFPPVFILHGAVDRVVPIEASQRFADRLVANGFEATVKTIASAPHGFFNLAPYREQVISDIDTFIQRCTGSCHPMTSG